LHSCAAVTCGVRRWSTPLPMAFKVLV